MRGQELAWANTLTNLDRNRPAAGGKRKRELGDGDSAFDEVSHSPTGLAAAVAASKKARTETTELREEAERVRQEITSERARAVATAGSLREAAEFVAETVAENAKTDAARLLEEAHHLVV